VSIVIPVFNRREQVISAVDSALAQTFGDLEIIVVNDGSTDRTPDTLATLRPQAKLLRLPENRGPSPARNVGTAIARGEFVMLLDSDDELLPEAIARHVGVLDRHPPGRDVVLAAAPKHRVRDDFTG
jgi:glycosyltransferase involved in cell wall biosynthesis